MSTFLTLIAVLKVYYILFLEQCLKFKSEHNYLFVQYLIRFYELYSNLKNCSLKGIISNELDDSFKKIFTNISSFTGLNLRNVTEAYYCKIGYAFLDYKGNFGIF